MKIRILQRKRATFIVLLTLLLSVIGVTNATAQTFTLGNLNYSLNNDGASVTVLGHVDGQNATGELVIPESVELYGTAYPVTVIGDYAFQSCSGVSGCLVIPNSVITIGYRAFYRCYGFTGSLVIGDAVQTIVEDAFYYCDGFTGSLTIGNAVQTIGYRSFYYCTGFTGLTLGNSVKNIDDLAFYDCFGFTGDLVLPNSVEHVGYAAFGECHGFNGTLTLGNSLKSLHEAAFIRCHFTGDLVIPASVTYIENRVFADNNFTTLRYNATNCSSIDENWLNEGSSVTITTLIIGENVQVIPQNFLKNRTSFVGELVIPESVITINNNAFRSCNGFTSLSIGNSVTSIGENAFDGCTGFTGPLTIPNSVRTIGANAFSGCTGFTGTFTLGNSVTQIGNTAFFGACQGFTSFNLKPEIPPILGNNVFVSANYSMPVSIPCGTMEAYQNASGWSLFTNYVEPDPCIWEIMTTAYPTVGGVVSGGGIYTQGQICTLTATPIGDFVFDCWKENGEVVSNTATYAFTVGGNRNLVAQFINANFIYFADPVVESICLEHWDSDGDGFFSYTEAAAVTDLGQAFRDKDNITSFDELQYFTGLTYLNEYEIDNCDNLTSVILPESITYIGYSAFGTCPNLSSIILPEGLTSIDTYAFYGCSTLSSITLPESLTYLGEEAFIYCHALSSIQVQAVTPPECGWNVFNGVNHSIPVTVPCNTTADYQSASWWNEFTNYQEFNDCIYDISVSFSPEEAGTVSGAGAYQNGTTCTLMATPAEGRSFVCWTENGEVLSTDTIYSFTVMESREFGAVFSALPSEYITFADANVKAICVNYWDFDDDGELSYAEAAAVTSLGQHFKNNTEIVWFNELQYFTGLSSVGAYAFSGCTALASIVLPPSLTSIGICAFNGCSSLTCLLDLPETLTLIDDYAFNDCSGFIGGLTIPNSVTAIGDYAFNNCSGFMGLLTIGESVTTIGSHAFNNCRNLTGSINIPNSVITIGDYAFNGSTAYWGTLTIGNSVTTIGEHAFSGCTGLVGDIEIPNSVTTIGWEAFNDCHSFGGTLTIPSSVTSIGGRAFYNCSGLSEVNYNVTNHADYYDGYWDSPFKYCSGHLTIGNSVIRIPQNMFYDANFTGNLAIPNSVTMIGNYAFYSCNGLTGNLVIPNSVTSIGTEAFRDCTSFNGTLTLSNSLATIASGAFYNCHSFTGELVIPNSVVAINENAFYNCYNFTGTLAIPNSMNTIGVGAFKECNNLSHVIMGINVMIVGNQAFYSCDNLQTVTLPVPVTVIGIEAFRYCTQLYEVNMQAPEAPSIGWDVFSDNAQGRIINIPCGATANYSEGYWEEWADVLNEMCDYYEVTVEASPSFAGSVTGGGFFNYSENCTITATSNIGYPFLYWTRNGMVVSYEATYTFGVTESGTYVANFSQAPVSYDIAVVANIDEAGTIGGEGSYLHGSIVNLNATANEGYHFANWTKNGQVVSYDATYTFNATEACTYVANFSPNDYNVTAEANPAAGGTVVGVGLYGHNTMATLTAIANAGYTFINWTKDGTEVSVDPTYSFVVTEACNYVANFELNSYEIVAEANPTECGTVTGAGTYNHFETCILTAIGNEGYPFINWMRDGVVVSNNPTYSFTVTEACTFVANFQQESVSYEITATADPEAFGSVEGAGTYLYGATATLTATPNEHYYFINWTKNDVVVSTENILNITVTEAGDYVAHFALLSFNIELVASPEEGGTVEGGGTFYYGDTTTLVAMPSLGYHFVNWTEDGEEVSTETSYSFTVTSDRTLTANFARTIYFTAVGVNPLEAGAITCTEGSYYGDTITLTAVANVGYEFVNWTRNDTVVSTEAVYSFIVTQSGTYMANFEEIYITQVTPFTAGWNWYSTYIEQTDNNGLEQLENSLGNNGVIVKSRDEGYVEYFNINGMTGWYGSLEAIYNEQMYKVRTNAAHNAIISGFVTNPADHPISIGSGWNWIGYPYTQAVSVETALEGFTPENNDVIKGRDGYTTYYSDGEESMWFGSLNSFEPGQGYMYHSNSTTSQTLTFNTGRGEAALANITPEGNVFKPRGESFADNMTVTAIVELDGVELRSEDYELAAFAGEDCRGSVRLMYVAPINRYLAFLTVFGEGGETLRFRLTDGLETVISDNELTFVVDGVTGSLAEPYAVQFRGITGIDEGKTSVMVYPNPSNGVYHIEGQGINRIEVYDALGQLIHAEENCNDFMQINLKNRANGVYVLRVITNNGVTNNQIIKQ
jgi:hypothetical protein